MEIEKGLLDCLVYLARYMPADSLYLERHEKDLSAIRFVARASLNGCAKMDMLVPLPEAARVGMSQLEQSWHAGELPPVLLINRTKTDPFTQCILVALGISNSSVMSLPLTIEDQIVGALTLVARGKDRFHKHHARLYATLKETCSVAMSNALHHEEVVKLKDLLIDDNRFLHQELLGRSGNMVIGADYGLRSVVHLVRQVAPTDSPVLLTGETGVGKDVVANAIHLSSSRGNGPFIPVNCGAIPDSVLDSELFGHEKGAFTGALSKKRGRFERANGGTIFLDEIGDMPLSAQVRLLRVIQHREIERVGGTDSIPVDIRIIAATHQDLTKMIHTNRFREDLLFRLNIFPIVVPPLRDRLCDIPALVQHFIERKARELKMREIPHLAPGAIDDLMSYNWPGNVRELENLIERAIILHRDGPLRFDDPGTALTQKPYRLAPISEEDTPSLDTVVARHIRETLNKTGGRIHGPKGAGKLLGINPNTLRYKMKKLGIPFRKHVC